MENRVIQKIIASDTAPMPWNKDAEEAVIGALLIEGKAVREFMPRIKEEFFYMPEHLLIFRAIRTLNEADKAIDILSVTNQLIKDGTLEAVGGPYNVTQISGKVASSAHTMEHILILQQLWMRRRLRELLLEADHAAADMTIDAEDTLVNIQKNLESLANNLPINNEFRQMPEVMDEVMNNLLNRMENVNGGLTGTDTGAQGLNDLLLGWQPGTLNVIAARPGEGKTAFLMHTLLTAAKAGKKVCLISLESTAEKLAERWMLARTDIPADDWNRGRITPEQWEEAQCAANELKLLHILTFDHGKITVEEICSAVKSLHVQGKCDLLGIDYLQLMANRHTNGVREQEVAHNSRLLKLLSLKLEIPILALSQLNREVKTNQHQIPRLENLRESGSIEQDSDTVALLFHPAKTHLQVVPESNYPVSPDMLMVIVDKNRNGRTGTVYLSHNESMTKFADYVPPQDWLISQATSSSDHSKDDWRSKNRQYQEFKRKSKAQNNGEKLPF